MKRERGVLRMGWRVLWVGVVVAGCATAERSRAHPGPPTPGPLVEATPVPERWIRVRKTERLLFLYDGDQVIRTYSVVLGKDPVWAKLYQGDHRTPEGEYHVIDKYFHPYWPRFLMLDYPTPYNQEIYAWSRAHDVLPVRRRGVPRHARGHAVPRYSMPEGGVPSVGGAIGIHGTKD